MIMCDYTLFLICLGTGILGALAGIVGSWLFLEKKSLFGDTIAHATLPGLTCMFLLSHSKHSLLLLIGGLCSAFISTWCIQHIQNHSTLKKDAILGIILATSFGIGTVLLSKIQTLENAHQAGLTKYLLGNPATILQEDIIMIVCATSITLFFIFRYIKAYTISLFDHVYANSIGIPVQKISYIMLVPITITIVFGLQAVGIILMSALLINPAAAAYQWTKNFYKMMLLSASFGAFSTIIGTIISCSKTHLPTGPVIVIIATTITALSILCSPHGIIMSWYQQKQQIKYLQYLSLLPNFLLFNEGKDNPFYAHNINALTAIGKPFTHKALLFLSRQGFIQSSQPNFWQLTPKGLNFITKQSL